MKRVGIICEYNPFHLGHARQFAAIREKSGQDAVIICLMSGNFVQRGAPAVFGKEVRAMAALLAGADLVLELPVTYALSSAEGFAAGGVEILTACKADLLCFGTESGGGGIVETAKALLSPEFSAALRPHLEAGLSFPAARCRALGDMGLADARLEKPNDILAVEYCKAILRQESPMELLPIFRPGDYHAQDADRKNPSATALRGRIAREESFLEFVPEAARQAFENAVPHRWKAGERAVLARLRTMRDGEFEALPYSGEGLWRRFMAACRSCASAEEILEATKSKRYTRTRLDRMLLCAFLGLTARDLAEKPPYVRVLAFNDRGRAVLREAKGGLELVNAGEHPACAYYEMERRLGELYGLFAEESPEAPGREDRQRVFYSPGPAPDHSQNE